MRAVTGFKYDIEANGLLFDATKVWVIRLTDLETAETEEIRPFEDKHAKKKFLRWVDRHGADAQPPYVVGHNILGYDQFILLFILGIAFRVGKEGADWIEGRKVEFVDTLYLSQYLDPDRNGHALEAWGRRVGVEKMDWRQEAINLGLITEDSPPGAEFQQWHPRMGDYCNIDVNVTGLTLKALRSEWKKLYGYDLLEKGLPAHFRCGQKSFFLMACQELAGWKFDQKEAPNLKAKIEAMMEEIRAIVEPQLPPRGLKKGEQKNYTMPAKPFKKDGSYSATWEKFVEKHKGEMVSERIWKFYGKEYLVEAGKALDVKVPCLLANQEEIKEYFLSLGWEPTLWNVKKDANGKKMYDPETRKPIQTTPKLQEAQVLCSNLKKLKGDLPKQIVKWLSLRNRLAVLEGWMENPRLQYDGRIGAGKSGIAVSHRQKHKVVVNVPKASPTVLLGYEFRAQWIAEEGYAIAAFDASGLEGRVQGHYTYKYDNGATAKELLSGDPHSKAAKAFYKHIRYVYETDIKAEGFSKDDPKWKPYRDRSKNGGYALLFGASGDKLASVLGLSKEKGDKAKEEYWKVNPGTKKFKDALEKYWETNGKKKYLPAIDGRILHTRKKSALLNTVIQSCGGIAMDYAMCFMDSWLGEIHFDEKRRPYYLYKDYDVRRIGYFHDEAEFECKPEIAETIKSMGEKAIATAGKYLKLNVPLKGEGKVGKNWMETH